MSTTQATGAQGGNTQTDVTDKASAQYWGIGIDDLRRYQSLMKGMRGSLSDPRITPIEVLGIHARDDAERRRYAEMFARMMAEDTERVLRFQQEYQTAFHRLYPNLKAMDLGSNAARPQGVASIAPPAAARLAFPPAARAGGMSQPTAVAAGDRLLVFSAADCAACEPTVRRALALAKEGVVVDLYVVGSRVAADVQKYAQTLGIDPSLVSAGRVTLNLDGGVFARVLPRKPALPGIVRKRGEGIVALQASDL